MRRLLKQQLRKAIASQKQAYTPAALLDKSTAIATRLMAHPKIQEAHGLMLYHSLPDEVGLTEVLACYATSKQLYLPKVVGDSLTLHAYSGPDDVRRGAYNILEPITPAMTTWSDIDVIVVPGVAFDSEGYRLGRGKGYYDRFLSEVHKQRLSPYLIGVCFDFQYVVAVPYEAHDWRMHEVIAG